jgi:putative nucleotidyltransferase with HDIG domain
MVAKILQLVNSAFFGMYSRITTPEQAIMVLGLRTIHSLVLTTGVFSQFNRGSATIFKVDAIVQHSLQTAIMAKEIAMFEGCSPMVVDGAFTSGLLHDIGKLVLAANLPERYEPAWAESQSSHIPLWQAERNVFGVCHAEIGAYLMTLWGLPDAIVEAIAFHHYPSRCPNQQFGPVAAVHIANALCLRSSASEPLQADKEYIEIMGLSDHVKDWEALARRAEQKREMQ